MKNSTEIFESAPVPLAVAKMAVPTVASMLVSVVYNMVDTFFVGQLGDANQVAAVSIATPVFLFLMAAGNVFGVGGSSFISRTLGEKKPEKIKNISSFCFYGGLAASIVGMLIFLLGTKGILGLVGASEATYPYAAKYLEYIAYGAPTVVLSVAFTNLLRGEGAATVSMVSMMSGTVTNIILDPVFILPSIFGIPMLDMGVTGAAVATVIGNVVTLAICLWHALGKNSLLSIHPRYFTVRHRIALSTVSIGIPASVNNVLMSLSNIVMNIFLKNCDGGGDNAIAGMGVAMKANMLVVFLQFGVAMGTQPLIGYNFGAKNFARMKHIMRFAMLCTLLIGSLMTGLYIIFSHSIIRRFVPGAYDVIDLGCRMLNALMMSGPFLGILFMFSFTFQAMGKALPSLALAVSRQGFVFLPMLFIGRAVAGLYGVIYAQPVADIISILMALCMFLYMNKGFRRAEQAAPPSANS